MHGCARELAELVQRAGAWTGRVVLVGDLFTKGPLPGAVLRMIREGGFEAVLGNHDDRLLRARAGQRPADRHAAEVCRALDAVDPDWETWMRGLPLWTRAGRYLVTHAGLHPSGDPALTDREGHLFRRRWPDDAPDEPFWWEVYEGPPVIFGHDARRGLVQRERDGEPWVIGLDTGCVYGKALSGWLVEEERLVQVAAARPYSPVG